MGVKGEVTSNAMLISAGFLLILIGSALWLGEVPMNLKKLIEAKTGEKAKLGAFVMDTVPIIVILLVVLAIYSFLVYVFYGKENT